MVDEKVVGISKGVTTTIGRPNRSIDVVFDQGAMVFVVVVVAGDGAGDLDRTPPFPCAHCCEPIRLAQQGHRERGCIGRKQNNNNNDNNNTNR